MVEIDTSSSIMSTELTLGLGLVSTSEMCGTKVGLFEAIHHESEISTTATKPEIQVVGWPPVRLQRKKEVVIKKSWSKYVKVAVDGVPYLRKVDLEMYTSYDHLLNALPHLFTMCNFLNEGKLMDPAINVVEYLPTYEDNDGDWMLLGDVPWKMFVESCKRLRLMKISEATGFAPRTSLLLLKCSSTAS